MRYIAAPLNLTFQPEAKGELAGARFLRMRQNVFATIAQCVQPSTQGTYESGWKRWVRFCQWFEIDPYLRAVPIEWVTPVGEIPIDFKEMAAVSFLQKLCIEEKLCPGTVAVYLSAVRYYFKIANLDINFLESPWVSSARTAVNLIYRRDNPIAGRTGLPFTCDMIIHAKAKTCNTGSAVHQATITAMELASACLLRVSEYIPGSPEVDHWLRAQDVAFRLLDNSVIPSYRVSNVVLMEVVSAIVTVRGSKNDIEGEGHRFELPRSEPSDICAYDLVADLHSWAVRAQLGVDRPFFAYQNEWTLSYDTLSRAIKLVAAQMGLNPARFRTHSLRIGGASMMAAAGRPDYEIMKLGRWKSLAFLGYIRMGKATFRASLAAIANPTLLTVQDVGRMYAGA